MLRSLISMPKGSRQARKRQFQTLELLVLVMVSFVPNGSKSVKMLEIRKKNQQRDLRHREARI